MDSTNHTITLENIKDNQIFYYSLIICKGQIKTAQNKTCKSSFITVENNDASSTHPIQKLNFKILLNLKLGFNETKISYCCSSIIFKFEFRELATHFKVVPIYIISDGHDGTFQAPENELNTPESAQKRITLGCKLIQSLIAEKLYECGFERKTFQLEGCVLFRSKLNWREVYSMNQTDLWYYFAREIMSSSLGSSNNKYLAFLSCTRYNGLKYSEGMGYDDILNLTKGYVAFGGEGLALVGTACLYTWPQSFAQILDKFSNNDLVNKALLMDDSCFRGTLSGCFATTLGATLHELCHTFDLGHSKNGIMGRGFDNTQNVFLSNSILMSSNEPNIFNRRQLTDDIFFNKNCATILNYHKWFNLAKIKRNATITYDKATKVVKSTAGLGVVEIRKNPNDLTVKFWIFCGKVLKYCHQIDAEFATCDDLKLFVEDVDGNVFKVDL